MPVKFEIRKKKYERKNLKTIALAVVGFGLIYLLANIFTPRYLIPTLRLESLDCPLNLLIMGTDVIYGEKGQPLERSGRSDVMVLAKLDPFLCRMNLLSIPRDTMAEVPGYGLQKINAANFYGGGKLAKKTVSRFFGVLIDAYVSIDTRGLIKLIDLLGGVDIYVGKDMYYVDRAGHLSINLKKGWHRLSGKESQDYVRYRKDDPLGDVGRVGRQQQFLESLFKRLASPFNLFKAPWLIQLARENIKTDLSFREVIHLMNFSRMVRKRDVKMALVPGKFSEDPSVSYWLPDLVEMEKIINADFSTRRWP